MHGPMPPLNALRAFEAAARHLSLTKAARELHVTPGALSHQIRGLEELLGLKLFERRVRAIALSAAGKQLYPGLQTGFNLIRDAVSDLNEAGDPRVLVVSAPTGFTSKWLVPRLHHFSSAHPEIDIRVSASMTLANFKTDGVDVALRTMVVNGAHDPGLAVEKLIDLSFVPVCSPKLFGGHLPLTDPALLKGVPLIHDDNRAGMPGWAEWFAAAGVEGVDLGRGLRFNSADHALDMAADGAGVFLAHEVLARGELRNGRLAIAFDLTLHSNRAYHFVCLKRQQEQPNVRAFRNWIRQEIALAQNSAGDVL